MDKMDKKLTKFVKYFLRFIDFSEDQKELRTSLKLNDFVQKNIKFDDFLRSVFTYTSKLRKTDKLSRWLCDATERLINSKQVLTEESLNILCQLISDATADIQIKLLENGISLLVTGNNFCLSDAKKVVESGYGFESGSIREVRFISRSVLHVDCNLEQKSWHGISVFIWTNLLRVSPFDITWNLSGYDNPNKYYGDAGRDSDGHGIDGSDGFTGESGGNVLIKANEVRNGEYLTILSNGGRGSVGQNGGSGRDGVDGLSATSWDILELATNLTWWYGNRSFDNAHSFITSNATSYSAVTYSRNSYDRWGTGFITAPLKSGKTVTYMTHHLNKSLCLVKGAKGTQGGRAGCMGYAGEEGFPGRIELNLPLLHRITVKSSSGGTDERAVGGYFGKNGISGCDMGRCAWIVPQSTGWRVFWGILSFGATEINYALTKNVPGSVSSDSYGSNSNEYLSLSGGSYDGDRRVWCDYYGNYQEIVHSGRVENYRSSGSRQRNTSKQNRERQQHARARKQIALNETELVNLYKENFSDEAQKDALASIVAKDEVKENIDERVEQEIQVNVSVSASDKMPANIQDRIVEASKIETIINDAYKKLTSDMRFLSQKYQALAALANITIKDTIVINSNRTDEAHYLTFNQYNITPTSQVMNELNKSISERESYVQQLERTPIDSFENLPESVLKEFVKEAYQIRDYKVVVKGCYEAHEKFVKSVTQDTLFKFCTLELQLKDYPELLAIFKGMLNNSLFQGLFEEKLKEVKNPNIKKSYEAFKSTQNKTFDWKNYFSNSKTVKESVFVNLTKHLGVCKRDCPTFMEILGKSFNQRICYYSKSLTTGKFELQQTFNASSYDEVLHLFKMDNKFYELSFNKELHDLKHRRKVAEQKYTQILSDVEQCRTSDQIQTYLKDKLYEKDVEIVDDCYGDSIFYNYVVDDDISFLLQLCVPYTKESEELMEKFQIMKKLQASSTIHYLADRLRLTSNTNITLRDIHLIINTVISYAEENQDFILINWIIVSQQPQFWINHVTMLRIENYLELEVPSDSKKQWLKYLEDIDRNIVNLICLKIATTPRTTLDMSKLRDVLYLLSVSSPKVSELVNLNLHEWAFVLKEFYWKHKLRDTLEWKREDEKFQKAIDLLLKIENLAKFSTTTTLVDTFGLRKMNLKADGDRKAMITILQNIADEAWSVTKGLLKIIKEKMPKDWIKEIQAIMPNIDDVRNVNDLVNLITNRVKIENDSVKEELKSAQDRILTNINLYASDVSSINTRTDLEIPKQKTDVRIKEWTAGISSKSLSEKMGLVEEMLTMINCAVKLWSSKEGKGFRLRDTQLLAALIIIKHNRNTLLQVSTGEGKSLIVAAVAIVRTLFGETVDIITTSSVLAKRDAEELQSLYAMFNITVGHNTDLQTSKRQIAYKNSHVVYGDLASFQRDYLLDKFYGNNVMSGRKHQNVIVDEVDSMLLDRGNNTLYLSHEIPELDKLEGIYLHIWTRVIMGKTSDGGRNLIWDTKVIAREIEVTLYGLIDVQDIKTVCKPLDQRMNSKFMEALVQTKLIDTDYCVILNHVGDIDALNEIDKNVSSYLLKLVDIRKNRILTKEELKRIQELKESQVEEVFQILKDEKIIDGKGKMLQEEMHLDTIKTNLSTYTGLDEILEPLVTLMHKLFKRRLDVEDVYQVQMQQLEDYGEQIFGILKVEGIIDDRGHLLRSVFKYDDIKQLLQKHKEVIDVLEPLLFLIQQRTEREVIISAPNYLKPFIMKNLNRWIDNAKLALLLRDQDDYVIDMDRVSGESSSVVTILDKDTGTDQANSQWDSGLHQFIQLKHGCRLTPQSLKAVFISNVSYFKLYEHLNGLSGTLGSDIERQHLVEAHEVDFLTLPTFKQKRFREMRPFVMASVDQWKTKIFDETLNMITIKNRSVLIICDTVELVEELSKHFEMKRGEKKYEIRKYTRDYEKIDIIHEQKKLPPGYIIIATNLAGRGTDIKLNDELVMFGGLHVILTFLSANDRIEQQAMGRAARKGERGSGQIIVYSDEFPEGRTNNNYKLLKLRSQRRLKEAEHVSSVRKYFSEQIQLEEDCFKLFKEVWSFNVDRMSTKPDGSSDDEYLNKRNEILKRGVLDKWAFWLDNNITHGEEVNKSVITQRCKDFLKTIETLSLGHDSLHTWVDDLAQLVLLGKCMIEGKYFIHAINHFKSVINKEPKYCEAAYYYTALAQTKNNYIDSSVRSNLTAALTLFEERKNYSSIAKALISNLKTRTAGISTQSKAFEEQQEHKMSICDVFLKSIYDLTGYYFDKEWLIDVGKCDAYEAELVFSLLTQNTNIINDYELRPEKMDISFENYCDSTNISFDKIKSFIINHGSAIKNLNEFKDKMALNIINPNREDFWKHLEAQKVIKEVKELYYLSKMKLLEVEPSLHKKLGTDKFLYFTDNDVIYLYPELESKDYFIIEKSLFMSKVMHDKSSDYLEKLGCITQNKCGTAERTMLVDRDFEQFSHAKEDALVSDFLSKSESKLILDSLVLANILEFDSHNKIYRPKPKFYSLDFNINTPRVYQKWIKKRLLNCFAYKVAYFKFCKSLMPNVIKPESLKRKTRGKDSITIEQAQDLLEALVKHKILENSCLGGYVIINDPFSIKFDTVNSNPSKEGSFTKTSFRWMQTKVALKDIEQNVQFDENHKSSLKIELMSLSSNVLLGQMIARGIIVKQKIINRETESRLKDRIRNMLSPVITIHDLNQFPSAQLCAQDILNDLKNKSCVLDVGSGKFKLTSVPSLNISECDTKTVVKYLNTRQNISQKDFVQKISKLIFDGRGTMKIFERKFEMVTQEISKCTSIQSKVEERQFITNSLDSVLIGQEKPEEPSFWGWIIGIIVSVVVIAVGVLLSVFGFPMIGAGLIVLGTIGLLSSVFGLVISTEEATNKKRQTEKLNVEMVSQFISQIQEQIHHNSHHSNEVTENQETQITKVINADIQRANFARMASQYQTIIQEELHEFEQNMYKLLDEEVELAATIGGLRNHLRVVYNYYNPEKKLDELEEFHLDMDRITDIIAPAFATFRAAILKMIVDAAKTIKLVDLSSDANFKISIHQKFNEAFAYYKINPSDIYGAVHDDIISFYVDDLKDPEHELSGKNSMLESKKNEEMNKREDLIKVSVQNGVHMELDTAIKQILLEVQTAYVEKINDLINVKLSDMSAYEVHDVIETTEDELRGSQGIIIRNMSLIKTEFNHLITKSKRLEMLHVSKIVKDSRLFAALENDCVTTLIVNQFERFIYKNVSYFSEIHQSQASYSLVHVIVKDFVERVLMKYNAHQKQLIMDKIHMLMLTFSKTDAYCHSVLEHVSKVTQFNNKQDIMKCNKNLFKLLVLSTLFKEKATVDNIQSNEMMCYTFYENELIISSTTSHPSWNNFQYCLNTMLEHLQHESRVTKVTILQSPMVSKSKPELSILQYLSSEYGSTEAVKIFQSNGNVLVKTPPDESDTVSVGLKFELTFIELLQEVAAAFSDVVSIANYCELNRKDIKADLYKKKVNPRKGKNIFHIANEDNTEEDENISKEISDKESNESDEDFE